jgi:hypothetical protein
MSNAVSSPKLRASTIALAGGGGALLAVAVALWAQYGSAVFYETILAGFSACF